MGSNNHGGARPNSGRKKAPYKTKTVSFRVRLEQVEPVKNIVKQYISENKKA